jgi:aldehyde dehydrogenase (NAD+)
MRDTFSDCYQTDLNTLTERIRAIFQKQQQQQQKRAPWTRKERVARLSRMEDWILANRAEIIKAIYSDFKKPSLEVESQEIFVILSEIRHAKKHLRKWMRPIRVRSTLPLIMVRGWIEYAPMGVVLIISPWNFPFLLSIGPLISAIASGNRAVLKPSEISRNTSLLVKQMMDDLFPEDEVAVFCGEKEVATQLLKYPFDHIFFTGSTEVGKIVMSAAAVHMSSVTMELGGKSPVVVDETADLMDAAKKIVWGKFMNGGQTCVAPDYVLVHQTVSKQLTQLLKVQLEEYYGKDEAKRAVNPDFARVIDSRHYVRLKMLMEDCLQNGTKIITGALPDNGELYIPPTILSEVSSDSDIMQEEIFGPILPVLEYYSTEEAIELIRANDSPLAVYLFSKNKKTIRSFFSKTQSGSGGINEVIIQFIHPNLPFGGTGFSGFGKTHGYAGFKSFSNERSFIKGNRWNPLKLLYPPFTGWKKKIVDILIRYF